MTDPASFRLGGQPTVANSRVDIVDLAWAAGFLEGEGSFTIQSNGKHYVQAPQVQREPLDRLRAMFGGSICFTSSRIFRWRLCGPAAAGLMMTLYQWMSPRRREQIRRVLEAWRSRPTADRFRTLCRKGHPLTGPMGSRRCEPCRREYFREWKKLRASAVKS